MPLRIDFRADIPQHERKKEPGMQETLNMIASQLFAFVSYVAVGVLLATAAIRLTTAYVGELRLWPRRILFLFLTLAIPLGFHLEGVFSVVLLRLPASVPVIAVFTLFPILSIASACKVLNVCHPGTAITLLGLPVGVLLSILGVVSIIYDLTEQSTLASALALLPAVTGGAATTIFYSWADHGIDDLNGHVGLKDRLTVFTVFAVSFMLAITVITQALVGPAAFEIGGILYHHFTYMTFFGVFFVVVLANNNKADITEKLINGALIAFGIGVAVNTVVYYGSYEEPAAIGVSLASVLAMMFYAGLMYVGIILWFILSGTLRPRMFALKNWHLAEIFTFWIFAVMSPPSLWEALSNDPVDQSDLEVLELRIEELEQRLSKE